MLGSLLALTEGDLETALFEVLKATPIAIAMIYLVNIFLKALDKRDERFDQITKGVIESNSAALNKNSEIISACKYVQQITGEK